jgi:hypothetical protein
VNIRKVSYISLCILSFVLTACAHDTKVEGARLQSSIETLAVRSERSMSLFAESTCADAKNKRDSGVRGAEYHYAFWSAFEYATNYNTGGMDTRESHIKFLSPGGVKDAWDSMVRENTAGALKNWKDKTNQSPHKEAISHLSVLQLQLFRCYYPESGNDTKLDKRLVGESFSLFAEGKLKDKNYPNKGSMDSIGAWFVWCAFAQSARETSGDVVPKFAKQDWDYLSKLLLRGLLIHTHHNTPHTNLNQALRDVLKPYMGFDTSVKNIVKYSDGLTVAQVDEAIKRFFLNLPD